MTDHEEIARLRRDVDGLSTKIERMRRESQEREIKRLRWGVMALGAVVMALGSWAWAQIGDLVQLNVGRDR